MDKGRVWVRLFLMGMIMKNASTQPVLYPLTPLTGRRKVVFSGFFLGAKKITSMNCGVCDLLRKNNPNLEAKILFLREAEICRIKDAKVNFGASFE
jgi:hypothetical protein